MLLKPTQYELESIIYWLRKIEVSIDLHGAYLRDVNLHGADLSGANLSGADLSRANLRGAKLCGADLSGAYLSYASLRGADLSGAKLCGADLYRAYLGYASLRDADLSGADLRGADLYRAYLNDASLIGASLGGANLAHATLDDDFRIARLDFGKWSILIDSTHTSIGCQTHPNEFWLKLTPKKAESMASGAKEFWAQHQTAIKATIKDVMRPMGAK